MIHLVHDARNAHSQVKEDFVDRPLNVLLLDCMHECSVMANFFSPMDWSQLSSSVHGIIQAGLLEWVAIFFSRASSLPRD